MQQMFSTKKTVLAIAVGLALTLGACGGGSDDPTPATSATTAWMAQEIIAEQTAASTDTAREAVANKRAKLLLAAMTLEQKMQQLTGAMPEILPELPQCYGARHVTGIAALNIPTLRITNGPVGLGQNDCVSTSIHDQVKAGTKSFTAAYTDTSSAQATALPSALGAAASFDPGVAGAYGEIIGTEMNNLALHVFEAPGVNMARIPVLGRNFEYFGEDPYLTGVMGVAEIKAVQAKGLIGMAKHFVGNEQETNRQKIQETIDPQVLREIYLLPFEMAVKDGKTASIMCAYNYVNGSSSCESKELLTNILRNDWGFTGYVQSDFFAMKSTVGTMQAGMDHEMPIPQYWSRTSLSAALAAGSITTAMLDKALERRYTQMFKYGIFDRPLKQTPIDFTGNGQKAREIGTRSAVLLQNNGALPLSPNVRKVVVIGKATQVYAQKAVAGGARVDIEIAGGSSDVMPNYTVKPVDGIRNMLKTLGNTTATVQLILVDDANLAATIDGVSRTFADVTAAAAGADAVIVMAGTIAEEGADRLTTRDGSSLASDVVPLAGTAKAGDGSSLDWYVKGSLTVPATPNGAAAMVKNSNTVAMIESIMAAAPDMAAKTTLVLKDNAGVAMPAALVGASGPAILEVWFPGQEDGNIVADLLFGQKNPSGKLPVTFPYAGKGFLDSVTTKQYPGEILPDGVTQVVEYEEKLHMGYRWYDGNISGQCTEVSGTNPCVAFPFGHGLSYTTFSLTSPSVQPKTNAATRSTTYEVKTTVRNTGSRAGSEAVQVYLSLPAGASSVGAAQPPKRLVGFQKVELAAGESKEVTITLDPSASNHPLSVWSKSYNMWITPSGTYTVHVGKSSSPKDLAPVTFTR